MASVSTMTPEQVLAHKPEAGRPYLKLCADCNRHSWENQEQAETVGVEVCADCAAAIDKWQADFTAWLEKRQRRARNAAKRKRRAQRGKR